MTEDVATEKVRSTSGGMTALRVIGLMFLCAYSWSMGQIPPQGLNEFGKVVALSFFVAAPALYFLPTIEAALRGQPNITSIALINTFLGWTLIGWVVAMAWGCKSKNPVAVLVATPSTASNQNEHEASNQEQPRSTVDTLTRLADLRDRGVLTSEEFDQQKAKILSES